MRKNMHLIWTDMVPSKQTSGCYWWEDVCFFFKLFMVKDHRYSCLWLDGFRAGLNQRCFSSYRKLSPPLRQQTIKSSCTIKTGNGKGFEFCHSNSVLMIQTFWFPALCVVGMTDHLCTGEAGVFNAGIWQQVVILAQPRQPLGQNGCRHRNTCNPRNTMF